MQKMQIVQDVLLFYAMTDIAPIFKTALSKLDILPFQPILESDVYNTIQLQIPEGQKEYSSEEFGELLAFQFMETYKGESAWNTFFGPKMAWENDDGTVTEIPSLSKVTPAIISYWELRSSNAKHPVLIARYAGLAYEFSYKIRGVNSHYSIAKTHVQALLNIVDAKLYKVPIYGIGKLHRALMVAIALNDTELISKVKTATIKLEEEVAINDKPGLWGFSYDWLIAGKKPLLTTVEETEAIKILEERMAVLMFSDTHATEAAALRLANYYQGKKQSDNLLRVLECLKASFENEMKGTAAIQQASYIEKLYHLYKQFHLNEHAKELLIQLREISKETDKELKSISASIDIPKEKIDAYVDAILKGNSEEVFGKIILAHVPKANEVKAELMELSKISPMQFFISKTLLDEKGRKVATIKPLREDPDSHLVLQLSNALRFGTMFLHLVFEEGIKREQFTLNEVMKYLHKSCIIEKDRFTIVQKGFEAYFNQEYLTFIHLLVPQFEEAIRNLVEMNGGNVLVPRNEAYHLRTFDHLLNDPIVENVFGSDMSIYFKILFTDNKGWNLRNNLAHGMLSTSHFNKQNSDRLLHAFLCLGMVRLKESDN